MVLVSYTKQVTNLFLVIDILFDKFTHHFLKNKLPLLTELSYLLPESNTIRCPV